MKGRRPDDGGFGRLRRQLTGWYTLVLTLILTVFGGAVYGLTVRGQLAQADNELRVTATHLLAADDDDDADTLQAADLWGVITDVKGRRVLASAPGTPADLLPDRSLVKDSVKRERGLFASTDFHHEPVRIYTLPVMDGDRVTRVIQLARPAVVVREQANQLLQLLLYSGLGAAALAAVGGWVLAGRAITPIRESYRRQRQFVADASHELRTPLAILAGAAEVLKRRHKDTSATSTAETAVSSVSSSPVSVAPSASEPVLDPIAIIETEVVRMGDLVTDLLTLANSDGGQIKLLREPTDLAEIARRAGAKASLLAQGKNLRVYTDIPPDPVTVTGDARRLEELCLILLDNAVKFTDQGEVRLRLNLDNGQAAISVQDTGPGIPAADLPHIFERFYRADKVRSRSEGAFGLGLSIAHWIAVSHGGAIAAQSSVGGGTTITVTLPLH